MNKQLFFFLVFILFACNPENKRENTAKIDFSFILDTVHIDAGKHLFYLGHGLPKIKLSDNEQSLYFFDDFNLAFDKIDLEKRKFVLSIPLQKEGPKGIGSTFDYLPGKEGIIDLLTPKSLFSINENGSLINEFPTIRSTFNKRADSEFFQEAKISNDSLFLYGLTNSKKVKQSLGWINLKDSIYNEVFVDSMAYRKALEIELGRLTISGMQEAEYLDNKIIVFHDDGIDFYVLDPISKSWEFHDFQPTIVPKRKEGKYPKTGANSDVKKILELERLEINYGKLVYDRVNNLYYRIASKKRENQVFGGIPDQFLLVFSKDYKLIHEENLSNLKFSLSTYFVRKGKIWVFNNEAEELQFLVIDINLTQS
ncbi:DUF4221 family protein [Algoriphagus aestuarii]|nr:DUF4221 family protein [Algoriphagus aestuarii]